MRLITGTGTPSNPIIDENFKEDVIKPIGDSKNTAESSAVSSERFSGGETVVNITSELVSGWLPEALRRFGCCRCSRCMAEASVEAFDRLPVITVSVRNKKDLEKAEKLRREKSREIMMTLVRIAVERKNLPKHES